MHDIEQIVRKLGTICYKEESKLPDSQMVLLDIGGIHDEITNKLHLVFYLQSGRELSSSAFVINKVYNSLMKDTLWSESAMKFEEDTDVDFMTLISYVYMVNGQSIDTDPSITVTADVIKVLTEHNLMCK